MSGAAVIGIIRNGPSSMSFVLSVLRGVVAAAKGGQKSDVLSIQTSTSLPATTKPRTSSSAKRVMLKVIASPWSCLSWVVLSVMLWRGWRGE